MSGKLTGPLPEATGRPQGLRGPGTWHLGLPVIIVKEGCEMGTGEATKAPQLHPASHWRVVSRGRLPCN